MFKLYLIYESGKRYIIPFEIVEKLVDKETLEKIKTAAIKEINKL